MCRLIVRSHLIIYYHRSILIIARKADSRDILSLHLYNLCTSANIYTSYILRRRKHLNINHAYPITELQDRDYVKKVNDSPDSAIHNTFSHFAAFFIVAVTKRFNVDRDILHVYLFII